MREPPPLSVIPAEMSWDASLTGDTSFISVHLPRSCSQQLRQASAASDNLLLKARAGARAS